MQLSIKSSAGLSKLHCRSQHNTLLKNKFLGEKCEVLLDCEQKIPNFVGIFTARLSKVHSKCPVDNFRQNTFFGKILFCFFSEFERDLLGLWAQNFQLGGQFCILNLQRNTLSGKLSWFSKIQNKTILFIFWAKTFQHCCHKWVLYLQRTWLRKTSYFETL